MAATVIQDVIGVSTAGDTVLVADGVYDSGGAVVDSMNNRVAINKAITVESVNGPEVTHIVGEGPMGSGAMRCAYVTNGSVLAGFTLTNGYAQISGDFRGSVGGGAFLDGGTVSNCTITGNKAIGDDDGEETLRRCG